MTDTAPHSRDTRALLELDPELLEDISALVEGGEQAMVLNLTADLHPADLARLIEHLTVDEGRIILKWLPVETASDLLPEVDDDFRAQLLEETRTDRIAELLDEMDSDEAADVLADLPEEVARAVLPALEESDVVEGLLAYAEDSAGGIMGTEFVAVHKNTTVAEATEEVRLNAEDVEPIHAVFVYDDDRRLVGGVSLKRLLLSRSGVLMGDALDIDNLAVTTGVDQEEVARIMERYDVVSLPVVDDRDRVVGRITIDDIVDVLRSEAEEDIQRMSGVAYGEEATDTVMRITRGRFPWLLAGLAGAGLSAAVIGSFHEALERAVILAPFIPVVMATAGNAGIQSSAIAVQGLASGDVWSSDVMRRFGKELIVSLINGVALAAILGIAVLLLVGTDRTTQLAITASLCLVIVITIATTIGATVPLLLARMGVDPAIATGPFITTTNDIIGILVFFLLAEAIYVA